MEFGPVLRRMRKRAGMSQEDIAEELHIARSSISKLERDQLELRAADLIRWCNATNAQEVLVAFLCGADGLAIMQNIMDATTTFVSTIFLGGIL